MTCKLPTSVFETRFVEREPKQFWMAGVEPGDKIVLMVELEPEPEI